MDMPPLGVVGKSEEISTIKFSCVTYTKNYSYFWTSKLNAQPFTVHIRFMYTGRKTNFS